jgi:hypothetical protein
VDAAEVLAQLRSDAGLREMARALLLGEELLRLPEAVARLAEGQAAVEHALAELVRSQSGLQREVGSLSRTLGGTAEEDALDALEHVVRTRGYTLLAEPTVMDLDGDGELDLAARVRDASGEEMSILVEAKVRLRAREVRAWAAQLADAGFRRSLVAAGVLGPYQAYAYGIRIYAEAREAARAAGIGVLSSRGEEVAPEAPAA